MRTVICFDVSDDRQRYKLGRVLLSVSARVQKSVFEAPALQRAAYLRLRSRCESLVDPTTDSIRYYRVCASCRARIEHFGAGVGIIDPPEPFDIIT